MLPLMRSCSLAFLAGAIAAQLTSFAASAYPLDRLFLGSLAVRLLLGRRTAVCFGLGVSLYLIHAFVLIDARLDPEYANDAIVTQVRVLGFPVTRDGVARFFAVVETDPRLPGKLWLRWQAPPVAVRGGDVWELVIRPRVPRGAANPGGFDVEAWLFREGVGATGHVAAHPRNRLLGSGQGGGLLALRQRLAARLARVAKDPATAAVLTAITVGARDGLSEAQWERYARTGASHLMAISGLHIGLAAVAAYGAVLLLLAAFRIRRGNHRLALCGSLLVAGAYVLVSGAGIPAVRAFVMLFVASFASLTLRPLSPFSGLAIAAVLLMAVQPIASGDAGFVLSFSAVLLLLWLARQSRRYAAGGTARARWAAAFGFLVRMQWVLLFGLLPATALLFERYAPAAPLVNLLIVPVFSLLIVPSSLLGLLLDGALAPAGDLLLRLASACVRAVEWLLARSVWPVGELSAELGLTGTLCLLLASVWAWLPRGCPGRALSWPALAALVLWQPERPPAGCARVAVLDVGQGQSVVVETRHTTLLYDTGPAYPGGGSAMQNVVLPYLRYRGIAALDVTVISHADIDHSGGLPALLAALPAGRLLSGEPLQQGIRRAELCHAVRPWRRDGVNFAFVATAALREGNNASCVLEIAAGKRRLLLAGDIERAVETELVAAGVLRQAAVVSIPHHGSRTSSSTAFVASVAAGTAIASAGHGNRWGFPKPDVVRRWQAAGTRVLSTGDVGAVGFSLCAHGAPPVPSGYRERHRRVWHSH
ncbi:MAG: DNA internalization-related competence protein ComEC/Rec2 [Pseudomonadota bacterium]